MEVTCHHKGQLGQAGAFNFHGDLIYGKAPRKQLRGHLAWDLQPDAAGQFVRPWKVDIYFLPLAW